MGVSSSVSREGGEKLILEVSIGTVGPAESAHFATVSAINHTQIIPLYEQPLYTGDWIGLRTLDEKGRLRLAHCPGAHMDLGGKGGCAEMVVREFVGWKR